MKHEGKVSLGEGQAQYRDSFVGLGFMVLTSRSDKNTDLRVKQAEFFQIFSGKFDENILF